MPLSTVRVFALNGKDRLAIVAVGAVGAVGKEEHERNGVLFAAVDVCVAALEYGYRVS